MNQDYEYTTLAQRWTASFPVFTYVITQINFWIIAHFLLVTVMNIYSHMISKAFNIQVGAGYGSMLVVAVLLGIVYGICLGLTGYHLERKYFRKFSLGRVILLKTLVSMSLLILVSLFVRFILFDLLISPSMTIPGITMSLELWEHLIFLLLTYYFFMALIISFINQVNKKYGPGVLVPLLLGRYRNPREEERIFMFMDLKSSTFTAEQLGHLQYSAFIRDCFDDINEMLFPYSAQVYQYVGDEVVLMWPKNEGIKDHLSIRFFFACKKQFKERADYYLDNYGFLPVFKAAVHMGTVTAVEIGEIKRDIAYHGDTLNITARIESVCNDFQKDFLVSDYFLEKIGVNRCMKTESLGKIMLRGKTKSVGIVSVEWSEDTEYSMSC